MISIIIVNYKVPDLLKKCIESIYASSYDGEFEIIVVDNASNDNSREIVTSCYPSVDWIQNDKNLGFSKAVNQGIKRGKGPIFLILNPDTILSQNSLKELDTFISNRPNIGIVGGKILFPDGSIQRQCRRAFPSPQAAFFRLFGLYKLFPNHPLSNAYELKIQQNDQSQIVDAVSGALMATTKETLKLVGMLDEGFFLYGEDLDFCYRVNQLRKNVYFLPGFSAVHHRGASREKTPFKTLFHIHHAMFRFFKKHNSKSSFFLFNLIIYLGILLRWIGMSLGALFLIAVKGNRSAIYP